MELAGKEEASETSIETKEEVPVRWQGRRSR
jgi:hypothetical protein